MNAELSPLLTISIDLEREIDLTPFETDAASADIDLGQSSGLNADRIVELLTNLKADTLDAVRSLVLRIVGAGEVKGVKITLDGVEIRSVQTKDLDTLRTVINETLSELARNKTDG